MIHSRYERILEKSRPFVISYEKNIEQFNLNPLNLIMVEPLDCLRSESTHMFDLLVKLDHFTFGDQGMASEKWVFLDCGAIPGAIFGLSVEAKELPPEYRLGVDDGQVPISFYIGIPTYMDKGWFGHNLSSLNRSLPSEHRFNGLGVLTKALAMSCFGVKAFYGATQWNSSAIHIHSQLADMELLSGYTPNHTYPNSFVYRSQYSDEKMLRALDGKRRLAERADLYHPSGNENANLELHGKILNGERFILCGRPELRGGKMFHPMKRLRC